MTGRDVATTKRKGLTPTQRLALFERRHGVCCVCGKDILGAFIDEHWRALGLGGSNDPSNRDIAHIDCAMLKTKADMKTIAKAKRVKKAAHGIKRKAKPIQSRNDLKAAPKQHIKKLPIPGAMPPLMRLGWVPATEARKKR